MSVYPHVGTTHPLGGDGSNGSELLRNREGVAVKVPFTPSPDKYVRVLRDDGHAEPSRDPQLDAEQLIQAYTAMVRTRLIDERMTLLQRQGRIGFHVGALGEEAAIVGPAVAARSSDFLFPCYREIGALLYRGFPLQRYLDNMFGNGEDVVQGRQMPDHYTGRAYAYASVSSVIGTQITHAVGYAWAAKLRRKDAASLVWFGDGGTSSSDFHAGANIAAVHKVPAVFLCRHNGWAISTPASKQTAVERLVDKAEGYGMRGVRVDGNDLLAVVSVVREALERGRAGEGPTFIELLTYRLGGHSTSDDPKAYRREQDVDSWRPRDPLPRLRRHLERRNLWTDAKQTALEESVTRELAECIQRAEAKDPPALATMFDDVYESPPWHLREQREQLLSGPRAKRH